MPALSPKRSVTITLNAEAIPNGAEVLTCAMAFIDDLEEQYAKNPNAVSDIGDPAGTTPATVLISGKDVNTLYNFDIYADISAGTYNVNYVSTVPNVDAI